MNKCSNDINKIYLYIMSYRVFSKQITNSYNDYINNKKFMELNKYNNKNNNSKNNNCSYEYYLNKEKACINKCEYNVCNKSPITVLQGKTSFICNPTMNTIDELHIGVLFPYGHYLCKNVLCTTCSSKSVI